MRMRPSSFVREFARSLHTCDAHHLPPRPPRPASPASPPTSLSLFPTSPTPGLHRPVTVCAPFATAWPARARARCLFTVLGLTECAAHRPNLGFAANVDHYSVRSAAAASDELRGTSSADAWFDRSRQMLHCSGSSYERGSNVLVYLQGQVR